MSAPIHGLMAEFDGAQALTAAARSAREQGYRALEAYSPFPIEGLAAAVGMRFNGIAPAVFAGGAIVAIGMYLLQTFTSVWTYPFNIGGRPHFGWPAFLLPALEMTFLGAALAGVVAMLILSRLPKYYHAAFNAPRFERASRDGFFLCIESSDPQFELEKTRRFLHALSAVSVAEVRS